MRIREKYFGPVVSLQLSGNLEVGGTAAQLVARVDRLVAADHLQLSLDLQDVRFVDSTGVKAVLHCIRGVRARTGALTVSGVSPPVRRLFALLRLDAYLAAAEE